MVLPEGFSLPPAPYMAALVLGVVAAGVTLWRIKPSVTPATVVGLLPWMALGGGLHVWWVLTIGPSVLQPLLGTPAVYVFTAILAGIVWIVAHQQSPTPERTAWILGIVGSVCFVIVAGAVLWSTERGITVGWPLVGLVVSVGLTVLVWGLLNRLLSQVTITTGWAGVVVVFGHLWDGVTTAIGVDILGTGERSPLPALIMDVAGQLPTAEAIGVGWAFVFTKLLMVVGLLWLFVDFVREEPTQAYVLLILLAAVGVGPGTHNALLFAVSG